LVFCYLIVHATTFVNQRVAVLTRAPSVSAPAAGAQVSQSSINHGMKVICKHGLPSHAFEDIIFRNGHVLAWDHRNRIPLRVAQHLSNSSLNAAKAAAEARKLKRNSNFKKEPSIPDIFKLQLSDFKGSGYNRGHTWFPPPTPSWPTRRSCDQRFLQCKIVTI
jgi:DNA/RNA endonuclease G (NUC1)